MGERRAEVGKSGVDENRQEKGGANMAEAKCICTADFCGHRPGERCGKSVTVILKTRIALGKSIFGGEHETGICEDCWATIKRNLPWLSSK